LESDLQRITKLDPDAGYITIINTYTVASERSEALLDLVRRGTYDTIRHVPGFISANLHMSIDRTRLVNYAQWQSREAIAAAGADPKVKALIRDAAQIADNFTPIQYVLRESVSASSLTLSVTDRTTHLLQLMKKGDDAFNARDFEAVDSVHHPDMIAFITGLAEPVYGREAHAAAMAQMLRMFPDMHVNTPYPIQFGSGDWITVVTNATGTFTGGMILPDGKVIAPTGKAFDVEFGQTSKWEGDRLIEISAFWDSALLRQQIGLAK
jgi:quinol monooxygenase YgiN/ketosteroid isomerase-like protein